jgi:leucyl-tRNA synthetase
MSRIRTLPVTREGFVIFRGFGVPATRKIASMTKVLITSALPYVNGVKHLGNLAGSLLPADVHARFRRQIGDDVLFICGTDEHGTPADSAPSRLARMYGRSATSSTRSRPTSIGGSASRSIISGDPHPGKTTR